MFADITTELVCHKRCILGAITTILLSLHFHDYWTSLIHSKGHQNATSNRILLDSLCNAAEIRICTIIKEEHIQKITINFLIVKISNLENTNVHIKIITLNRTGSPTALCPHSSLSRFLDCEINEKIVT